MVIYRLKATHRDGNIETFDSMPLSDILYLFPNLKQFQIARLAQIKDNETIACEFEDSSDDMVRLGFYHEKIRMIEVTSNSFNI